MMLCMGQDCKRRAAPRPANRFREEFVPVPRPLAGARARFNSAKEAEKHVANQEFEEIGLLMCH